MTFMPLLVTVHLIISLNLDRLSLSLFAFLRPSNSSKPSVKCFLAWAGETVSSEESERVVADVDNDRDGLVDYTLTSRGRWRAAAAVAEAEGTTTT
ncbi:hypothetical protein GW17_00028960 [Ensete ventricosum]|nr:hypothetical protein GW17_00028960 [Ensete ventricosum]